MRRFFLICVLTTLAASAGAAVLREAAGLVQVRSSGDERWKPMGGLGSPLAAGDSVRTGFNAHAVIALVNGAVLEEGGNAQLSIDADVSGGATVNVARGTVRVNAPALGGSGLKLRAPTATALARSESAVWRVTVGGGGSAVFQVEQGVAGIEDTRGEEMRLRAGERMETDLAGLHEPTLAPTPGRARRDDFAERMRRELAFDQEAEAIQNVISAEMRAEEYQLGRVLTNAAGDTVRAEEFVVRAAPNSFKFVTLNESRGAGLSWYSWAGIFDLALPKNLAPVFAILPGSAGAPAPWTLTAYTSMISNGLDSLVSSAAGGHQVNLNGNSFPADSVSVLYNPVTDVFTNVSGQAVYKVLFDRSGLYSDGVLKSGLIGTGIQSPSQLVPATINDPLTGAALAAPLPSFTTNTTFPNAGAVSQVVYTSYSDGTTITTNNRAISPGGGVVSRAAFGDATSGPPWDSGLLRSAIEQTATASEFGGRSIDVMVSPRILVETGGLP